MTTAPDQYTPLHELLDHPMFSASPYGILLMYPGWFKSNDPKEIARLRALAEIPERLPDGQAKELASVAHIRGADTCSVYWVSEVSQGDRELPCGQRVYLDERSALENAQRHESVHRQDVLIADIYSATPHRPIELYWYCD